jgi:hypothetical protein
MKKSAGNYFKIGLALVFVGLVFLLFNYAYILTTTSTEGTVISIDSDTTTSTRDSPSTTTYLPTFTFQDELGVAHEAPASSSSSTNYKMGKVYTVGYDPDDFSVVYVIDWGKNIKFPLIFFAIAGFVFWMSSSIRKTGREWAAEQT